MTTTPDEAIATLSGELDLASADILHAGLAAFVGRAIRLEMDDITFLDSCGLRALLVLRSNTLHNGGTLTIGRMSDQVERLFEVAGVASMFQEPAPH